MEFTDFFLTENFLKMSNFSITVIFGDKMFSFFELRLHIFTQDYSHHILTVLEENTKICGQYFFTSSSSLQNCII